MESQNNVHIPEAEVAVFVSGSEIFTCQWRLGKTPHDDIEVTAYVREKNDVRHLVALLQDAITLLRADSWLSMDALDNGTVPNEKSAPF